ncbi:tectonic-1 isoform X1 [Hypanus sabinus]|uniref:tectonic-1 isoform X1 n=1 Tax=Hypanus sabinus TaxID=79690 RepID=UPI0028C3D04E|nr:tectonic-1 isoform X1 [Hypanus sabinus]
MDGSVSLWMVWAWFLVQGPTDAVLEVRADKFAERISTSSPSGSTENPTHTTKPKPTTQVAPKVALPRASNLPDLKINVRTLCVCNLLVGQCDVNCCCDPDCMSSDRSTFSTCDVHIVTGDNELCRQDAAMYSTNSSEVVTLINPNLFCIETNNYKKGSSFFAPEVPSTSNFNSLMKQFSGFSFSTDKASSTLSPTSVSSSTSSSYQYGMPIKVRGGYLKLPAPLATTTCTDNNPAAFLIDQTTHCSRRIQKSTNCTSLPAFSISNYLNVKILPSPDANLNSGIPVFLSSITLKSLNGTLIRLKDFAVNNWLPNQDVNICRNIVLEVKYIIVYNSKGTIVNALAALVLGTIDSNLVPVQQRFQIIFIQENTVGVPVSGNPGYIVGLPLVAGFGPNATVGIIQSKNRFGQLTVMKSSANQDCLQMVGFRTPVLFGYNLNSGCIMRITNVTTCHQWSNIIRNLLIGQNFPQSVASFGNTPVQNVKDWVTIQKATSIIQRCGCEVPESLMLEVKWTKYGSLINPQAKIVEVTQTIRETCILRSLKTATNLYISTSVKFTDVSTSAQPGYKSKPMLYINLPYDFFFPFV